MCPMLTRSYHLLLFLVCFALGLRPSHALPPSLAGSLPGGAAGFIEISGAGDLLKKLEKSSALQWALSTEEYLRYEASDDYRKLNAVRATAQLMLGMPVWDAAAGLLSGRIAAGIYFDPAKQAQPTGIALLQPENREILQKVRDVLTPLLDASATAVDTGTLCAGTTTWQTKDGAFLCLHNDWIAATQQRDLLEKTLAILGGSKTSPALNADPGFAAMQQQAGGAPHVVAWLNTPLLRQSLGKRFGIPAKMENGLASLLLGGLVELAAQSDFTAAALNFTDTGAGLRLTVSGDPAKLPAPAALWFPQHPESGTNALPQTPGTIAAVTVHRKLGEWYRHRDQLLADSLLPGFDKFETDIGNLLPRKDFGQDVLPLIGDNFTLVAALQDYTHLSGSPGIKLPAFAAIFDLPKPAEGADTFALFFQTLSAILNLQAGQEGRQPSVLDSEFYKDTKISVSRFLEKPAGDRLPIAYNFQPAGACVGRKYIIATSLQLCRDLIDHFKDPESLKWRNHCSEWRLHADSLAKLAELNEGFLRSQEIQKGHAAGAAEQRIGLLLKGLRQLEGLHYQSSTAGGLLHMKLDLNWK